MYCPVHSHGGDPFQGPRPKPAQTFIISDARTLSIEIRGTKSGVSGRPLFRPEELSRAPPTGTPTDLALIPGPRLRVAARYIPRGHVDSRAEREGRTGRQGGWPHTREKGSMNEFHCAVGAPTQNHNRHGWLTDDMFEFVPIS